MGRLLALAFALIMGLAIAWTTQLTPSAASVSAPAERFSAERAMADVRTIAKAPHPIGSAANAAVRDYLIDRMTELGLSPHVRIGPAFTARREGRVIVGGEVENLVGVLPGRDRSAPAVALMAHYDSVPGSPGAADDAAGVSAALETVRAIRTRGTPERDLMVVFTDGEEAGLLGAEAFFRADPLAKRIGLILNMETRGAGGRAQMFETSFDSGGLVKLVRQAGGRPSASSLTSFIYRLMPNDTDFTLARQAGIRGLNYAFIGRQFEYHSPTATPANLERGALQDMGGQVLAVADRAARAQALPGPSPAPIYSQVFGNILIAYPVWGGWLLLAASAGLIAVGAMRARRLETLSLWDAVRGAGAALTLTLTGAVVLLAARKATEVGFGYLEQRRLLAQIPAWETAVMLLATGVLLTAVGELARGRRRFVLLPLAAALAAQAFGGLDTTALVIGGVAMVLGLASYGRPSSRSAAWLGVLCLGLALSVAVTLLAPAASYALAWPLAAGAAACALTDLNARSRPLSLAVLGIVAAVSLGWIGGMAHLMFLALDYPAVLALPMLMAAMVLWPLAQPTEGAPPERLTGPILLGCGVAAVAILGLKTPYDGRYPKAASVIYRLDQNLGRAWRISDVPERADWSDAVMRADGGRIATHRHWSLQGPAVAAPAFYRTQPSPQITVTPAQGGAVRLRATPPDGVRTLTLRLKPDAGARIIGVAGLGADIMLAPGRWTQVRWEAAQDGLELTLAPGAARALKIDYAATIDAWPDGARPPPPPPSGTMAFGASGSTLLTGSRTLTW